MQGAGGVGGLLVVRDETTGSDYYPSYDGNGNVMALVATDATTAAVYHYDAFGKLTRSSGAYADENPSVFPLSIKIWIQSFVITAFAITILGWGDG